MTTDDTTIELETIAEYAIASQSPDRMDVDRHQQAAARGLAAARAELPARDPQHTPDTVVALDPTARAARLRRRAQARSLHRIDQPTGDDAA